MRFRLNFIDYRRPLFHLEQWSPFLARKVWGLTPFLTDPLSGPLSLKVSVLTDNAIEVELAPRQSHSMALVTAGEYASKILWQRHLSPRNEECTLVSLNCQFLKKTEDTVRAWARAELPESERENTLRKIRRGEVALHETSVIVVDDSEQQLAQLNYVWSIKPFYSTTLIGGRS